MMRLVATALLLAATTAVAMVPEDLYDMRTARPVDLSPDGRYLLYSLGEFDRDEGAQQTILYRRDLDTGDELLIFSPQDHAWGAVWRPDGGAIAYLQSGDEETAIWLMAADGGDRRRVGAVESAGGLVWSPDGRQLAWVARAGVGDYEGRPGQYVVADDMGYRHLAVGFREGELGQLFVMDIETGAARRIVDAELDVRSVAWSPDGKRLVCEAKARADMGWNLNTDLYLVGSGGGDLQRITDNPGPDGSPTWLADGRIAWLRREYPKWESAPAVVAMARPEEGDRGEVELRGGTWDNFFWNYAVADGEVYILGTNRGCIDLVRAGTGDHEILTDTQHNFWSLQIRNGRAVLSGAGQTLPGAIFVMDLNDRRPQAEILIDPNDRWRHRVGLVEPEPFSVEVDGQTIAGWFFKPAHLAPGERVPTVLSIHGGPQWMYGGYFLAEFHILPSFGYGVVIANPTGSTGYGYEFQGGIRGDWIERPAQEVLACIDRAVADGWADPERLAVMGGSYGGHLTAALTTQTDRFRAAACDRMFPETIAFWGTTDEKWFPEWEFMGRPWEPEARAVYLRNSPFEQVENVVTPTLISQGLRDYRCLIAGGEIWFSSLQARGVPSRFIRFEHEGHGIRGRDNQVFYQNQLLNWFELYVLEKQPDHAE